MSDDATIFVMRVGENKFQERIQEQLRLYKEGLRQPSKGMLDAFADEVIQSEKDGELSAELFNNLGMLLLTLAGRVQALEDSNRELLSRLGEKR